MESHIQQKPDTTASESGSEQARSAAQDRIIERRRRFLTGGLATLPVVITTLANRPALAGDNLCTVSARMSGNLSRPVRGPCGSSPGCWRNHALSNGAASWQVTGLSPYDPFTGLFPIFKTLPWRASPTDTTLVNALDPSAKVPAIKVKISGSWVASGFPAAFPAQLVAGVLNARYYGVLYPYSESQINALLSNALSFTPPMTTSQLGTIKDRVTNLTNQLDIYHKVEAFCPVS
jgi:hypothetical protein